MGLEYMGWWEGVKWAAEDPTSKDFIIRYYNIKFNKIFQFFDIFSCISLQIIKITSSGRVPTQIS